MSDMAIEYERRPLSVDDFNRMFAAGIFEEGERVELLDGELIAMPPMLPPHAISVQRVNALLIRTFGDRASLRCQLPLVLPPRSELLPDVVLIPSDDALWRTRHPQGPDLLLAIEIAASSRRYDLHRKGPAYARSGIREYWVLDVERRQLHVHRDPVDGLYTLTRILREPESVAPQAFPDDAFAIEAML